MNHTTGLLLFAHGARDPRWAASFELVAQRVTLMHPNTHVRLAFLELMSPDLATAARELHSLGCRKIHVLPLFLGTGGHLRRDLPALVATLSQEMPDLKLVLQGAVGEHPLVIQAMADAAGELLA